MAFQKLCAHLLVMVVMHHFSFPQGKLCHKWRGLGWRWSWFRFKKVVTPRFLQYSYQQLQMHFRTIKLVIETDCQPQNGCSTAFCSDHVTWAGQFIYWIPQHCWCADGAMELGSVFVGHTFVPPALSLFHCQMHNIIMWNGPQYYPYFRRLLLDNHLGVEVPEHEVTAWREALEKSGGLKTNCQWAGGYTGRWTVHYILQGKWIEWGWILLPCPLAGRMTHSRCVGHTMLCRSPLQFVIWDNQDQVSAAHVKGKSCINNVLHK